MSTMGKSEDLLPGRMKLKGMCEENEDQALVAMRKTTDENEGDVTTIKLIDNYEDVDALKTRVQNEQEMTTAERSNSNLDSSGEHDADTDIKENGGIDIVQNSYDKESDASHSISSSDTILCNESVDGTNCSQDSCDTMVNGTVRDHAANGEITDDSKEDEYKSVRDQNGISQSKDSKAGSKSIKAGLLMSPISLTQDMPVTVGMTGNTNRLSRVLENMPLPLLYLPNTKQLVTEQNSNGSPNYNSDCGISLDKISLTSQNGNAVCIDSEQSVINGTINSRDVSTPDGSEGSANNGMDTVSLREPDQLTLHSVDCLIPHVHSGDSMMRGYTDVSSLSSISTGTDFSISAASLGEDYGETQSISLDMEDGGFMDVNLHSRNSYERNRNVSQDSGIEDKAAKSKHKSFSGFLTSDGPNLRVMADKSSFKSIELTRPAAIEFKSAQKKITANILEALERRFSDLSVPNVVQATRIADLMAMPQDWELLRDYGDKELEVLLMHFQTVLASSSLGFNPAEAEVEWMLLKKEIHDVNLFSRKAKENAATTESAPGWKLFGRIPPKPGSEKDPIKISTDYQAKQRASTHFPPGRSKKQDTEVLSTTALILENRPKNLPSKNPEEAEKHRQEYEAMVEAAKKKEQRELRQKKKLIQQQLRQEDQLVAAGRFWNNEVLPNWDTMKSNKRAKDLWWMGLPPNVRGKVWKLALGNDLNITQELYDICVSRAEDRIKLMQESASESNGAVEVSNDIPSNKEDSVQVIKLDVSRTFPQLCIFQKGGPYHDLLHSLLGAYACYRPDVGYVQGMSFIAAILLLNMDVADAFVCFANLLNRPCQVTFFRMDEAVMMAYYDTFTEFFKENLPHLQEHFVDQALTPNLFLLDWIFLIYGKSLPLDVACRVWDVYCRDGEEFLLRTALGILKLYEGILINMDFIHLAQFLTKLPENISADSLFRNIDTIRMNTDKKKFAQVLAVHRESREGLS